LTNPKNKQLVINLSKFTDFSEAGVS